MSIKAIQIGSETFGFDFAPRGWCISNVSGDLIPSKSVSFSGSAVTSVSDNSRSISFTLAPVEQLPPLSYREICTMIQSMNELVVFDSDKYVKITQDFATYSVRTTRDTLGNMSCPCIVTSCTYNYSDANPRITFTVGLTRRYFIKTDGGQTRLVTVVLANGAQKVLDVNIPSYAGEFYEYEWERNLRMLNTTGGYTERMRFIEGDRAIVNLRDVKSGPLKLKRAGNFEVYTYGMSHSGYIYNNMLEPVCDIEGVLNMFSQSVPSVVSATYTGSSAYQIDNVTLTPVRYIL